MGCNCGGGAATNRSGTLGYYVVLPDGQLMPPGVNPDDPASGEPPYFSVYEARIQVTLNAGGTIRRLRRQPVTA